MTSTSTSTVTPAANASVAVAEALPITNGASAALAHRRYGRVPRQCLTLNPFLADAATGRADSP